MPASPGLIGPNEPKTMSFIQEFPCKGKDSEGNPCPEIVIYEPQVVTGNSRSLTQEKAARKKSVYLTCEADHTHKYYVDIPD